MALSILTKVTTKSGNFRRGSLSGTCIFEVGLVWTAFKNDTLHCGGSTYNHGLQPGKILGNGTISNLPAPDDPGKPEYRDYRVRPDVKPTADSAEAAWETNLLRNESALKSRFYSTSAGSLFPSILMIGQTGLQTKVRRGM